MKAWTLTKPITKLNRHRPAVVSRSRAERHVLEMLQLNPLIHGYISHNAVRTSEIGTHNKQNRYIFFAHKQFPFDRDDKASKIEHVHLINYRILFSTNKAAYVSETQTLGI